MGSIDSDSSRDVKYEGLTDDRSDGSSATPEEVLHPRTILSPKGSGYEQPVKPDGVSSSKWNRIERYLESLPTVAAGKLISIIDRDRLYGNIDGVENDAGKSENIPHLELLNVLRTLVKGRGARLPKRLLSAQRIFFTPFEDFITPTRRGRKRRARLPRTALGRIWGLIEQDAACLDAARAAKALDKWLSRHDLDTLSDEQKAERDRLENDLYTACASGIEKLLTHAEADNTFRADLIERLGGGSVGAATMHDLAELVSLIPMIHHLKAVQAAFPKPVVVLEEERLYTVRGIYAGAHAEMPALAHYILLCLASRLEAPWRAVRLYAHFANIRDENLPDAQQDADLVIETMFQDLEGLARALERDSESVFDAGDAAAQLRYFALYADGVGAEARQTGETAMMNRAEACRDVAAAACERFAEQALSAIRRAQPTRHAGGSSRLMGLRPDTDRMIDHVTSSQGRAAAQFLADVREIAGSLGRSALAGGVADDAIVQVRRYANDVILEIRAAEGEDRARAKRLMNLTLEIADPLLPSEEVALLKEKSSVAAMSA